MRQFRIVTALVFLLAGELCLARASAAGPVTAWQLVRTVDSALAGAAQAAGRPGSGLDRAQRRFAPFWSALAGMRHRISQIEAALERRDGDFFLLVDQGSADLGALRVAWARAGVRNETVAEGVRLASASYRTLRAQCGREGLRHRQGGDLSEAERRQLQRLQRAHRRFAASLQPLRERSLRRGDEVTVAELDRFRAEAERIAWAPLGLEAYLNALIASGEMRGEWEADAPYIQQSAPEELAAADEMVQDLYVESDIGQVFTVNLGAAGAVQVFQPAEGEAEAPTVEEIVGVESVPVVEEDGEAEPVEEIESEPAEDLAEPEAVVEEGIVEDEELKEPETAAEPTGARPSPGEKNDRSGGLTCPPPCGFPSENTSPPM